MALFAFAAVLLLAFTSSSSATWCVCKEGSDTILQKTLDYACGAGADCNPLHQNGPCFQPNTVRAHCNYAVNSYFQRKGQAQGSCDFAGTATVTASDPSSAGCSYPASSRHRNKQRDKHTFVSVQFNRRSGGR
ncbi:PLASMODESMATA CALLOSE-BINDING PROTEIN 3 isoform X3 [Vigna angularis]|uniref:PLASMODESMATA CALLOSE-BINDING PROTEIN 3 isoform X3 n=1 Tax=Phaseolus angularis TaxID=3914 RepID=UPI00080A60CF|nr:PLASMODESMATA CALLOSE-BINDING PROTEIN 3 isoform X3 [Vigna angularis]